MEALIFVGIAALVVLGVWYGYYVKKKRREALARAAAGLGLEYAQEDPFGLVDMGFTLFSRGDGQGCENVVWGTWKGIDLRETDFWYYDQSTDSNGRTHRTYHHFSCVMTEIPVDGGHLTIEHENFFTRLADHVGFRDIEFESEDFNRSFQVKCKDSKFANDVVDARMMKWLQSMTDHSFEVMGNQVLAYCKRIDPSQIVTLFGVLQLFRDHIPRVVYDLYRSEKPQDKVGGESRERTVP